MNIAVCLLVMRVIVVSDEIVFSVDRGSGLQASTAHRANWLIFQAGLTGSQLCGWSRPSIAGGPSTAGVFQLLLHSVRRRHRLTTSIITQCCRFAVFIAYTVCRLGVVLNHWTAASPALCQPAVKCRPMSEPAHAVSHTSAISTMISSPTAR